MKLPFGVWLKDFDRGFHAMGCGYSNHYETRCNWEPATRDRMIEYGRGYWSGWHFYRLYPWACVLLKAEQKILLLADPSKIEDTNYPLSVADEFPVEVAGVQAQGWQCDEAAGVADYIMVPWPFDEFPEWPQQA